MNLLFDLDGTLADAFPGITGCLSYALTKLGRQAPLPSEMRWCIGPPLQSSLKKLLGTEDKSLVKEAVDLYREQFAKEGIFQNEIYSGIPETLGSLNEAGHTLYVATSKLTVFADRITDHFNLRRYFRKVYGSEHDGTRVEKTSLLSYILETESISASDTVMIGDREHDMTGAKANGIKGIGVLWGYGTEEELMTSGAAVCIRRPSEIADLLKNKL